MGIYSYAGAYRYPGSYNLRLAAIIIAIAEFINCLIRVAMYMGNYSHNIVLACPYALYDFINYSQNQ